MSEGARVRTVLERAIKRASSHQLSMQSVLWTLAASELIVPTTEDFDGNFETFKPLLLTSEDSTFLAVFTHPDKIGQYAENAPAFVSMGGEHLLTRMPPGNGITVNPGTSAGFELPARGIISIVDELSSPGFGGGSI